MFNLPAIFAPIDLTKGDNKTHPDIRTDGTQYLCLYGGDWIVGTFGTQWYGLVFHPTAMGAVPLQYDKPGTNASSFEALFRIVDGFHNYRGTYHVRVVDEDDDVYYRDEPWTHRCPNDDVAVTHFLNRYSGHDDYTLTRVERLGQDGEPDVVIFLA